MNIHISFIYNYIGVYLIYTIHWHIYSYATLAYILHTYIYFYTIYIYTYVHILNITIFMWNERASRILIFCWDLSTYFDVPFRHFHDRNPQGTPVNLWLWRHHCLHCSSDLPTWGLCWGQGGGFTLEGLENSWFPIRKMITQWCSLEGNQWEMGSSHDLTIKPGGLIRCRDVMGLDIDHRWDWDLAKAGNAGV